MIAFFTITEKQQEALMCLLIFIASILFLVTTYPAVNATNWFESEEEKFMVEKIDDEDDYDERFNEIVNNWR